MDQTFEQMLAGTKAGSFSSIAQLGSFVTKESYSEAQFRSAIFAFLAYLNSEEKPPRGLNAIVNNDTLSKVLMTIDMLTIVARRTESRLLPKSDAEYHKGMWPCMSIWLPVIAEQHILNENIDIELRARSKKTVLCTILVFIEDPRLQDALIATPYIIQMLVEIWVSEIRFGFLHPSSAQYDGISASAPLVPYMCLLQEQLNSQLVDEVFRFMVNDARKLVATALAHLRRDIKNKDTFCTLFSMGVLKVFSANEVFCRHMLSLQVIPEVSNLVVSLTAGHFLTDEDELTKAINICCHYLRLMLEKGDGRTWVIQAVENRIIQAILQRGAWSRETNGDSLVLLSSILPKYLIFQSALPAFKRALDDIDKLGLEKQAHIPESLLSKWLEFKEAILDRTTWKAVCRENRGYSKLHLRYSCNYLGCDNTDTNQLFKRCSKCKGAGYCSVEHQRLDWHAGHRDYCKKNFFQEENHHSIAKRDEDFLRLLLRKEIFDKSNEVHAYHRQHPTEIVAIEFNFMVFPPVIAVMGATEDPPDACLPHWMQMKPKWDKILAKSQPDVTMVFRAFIPTGKIASIMIGSLPINQYERNSGMD